MAYFHPDWIAHQRERWMPPRAQRWLKPEALRALGLPAPEDTQTAAAPASPQDVNEREWQEETERLRVQREIASLRLELALLRLGETWRKAIHHSNFQPRDDHGRWTDQGRAANDSAVRLAGPLPTNERPRIPDQRPDTEKERNRIARMVSRHPLLRGPLQIILHSAGHWLYEKYHEMKADQDPPKSLEELQEAASNPRRGYDKHHIVLQGPARREDFLKT
jgi:hypothetical protein